MSGRSWLTDHEQRVVDRLEENREPAGWGDPIQLDLDRAAGDAYEKHMQKERDE